ncbi:hypothetical protein WME99_32885 [Sorangium sp. So ce136]
MKLYFNPQSRAVITKWMLDECGATYELSPISFEKQEHKASSGTGLTCSATGSPRPT